MKLYKIRYLYKPKKNKILYIKNLSGFEYNNKRI